MGEGHRCHECTRAHCPGRLAFGLANRIRRRDYLHQHDPHLTLGGDCGLIKRAAATLPSRSPLYLYGPYKREGFETAPSNQAFAWSLRDRNPTWGLRDLEAVTAIAQTLGFSGPVITVECDRVRGRATRPRLSFSRSPDTCGWPRGSQLRVPFPSHRPDVPTAQCLFRPMLFEPVAVPTRRRRICLAAVELLADRSASPRLESDAAPSALEMG
jgi:hypothetical protein